MSTDIIHTGPRPAADSLVVEPTSRRVVAALGIALAFVAVTRIPVARSSPIESDEFGFLAIVRDHWFPMHHTLFLALARLSGLLTGDPYRGFIALDMLMSSLALVGSWWWLRGLAGPKMAAAATLMLGLGPLFWGYGAVAGNYPAIIFVGSILLGIAVRTWRDPEPWHPYAASAVLAFGAGYRSDIGTLWLPIYGMILWRHRWPSAIKAGLLFVTLSLTWFGAMLADVGGWTQYREASSKFALSAGYLNSIWNLGLVDSALRYSVKLAMALFWTLGPALLFLPRGMARLRGRDDRALLATLLAASVVPALGMHLLVHFGSPGYAFHYIPALLALIVLGIGRFPSSAGDLIGDRGAFRLAGIGAFLALVFWFYPTNFDRPGWSGSFDLAFARHTRAGLRLAMPGHDVGYWRTANSRPAQRSDSRVPAVR